MRGNVVVAGVAMRAKCLIQTKTPLIAPGLVAYSLEHWVERCWPHYRLCD